MPDADAILRVRGLSCRFGGLLAVDALDLDVPRGGILALIGPNGAGKSTTVNLLSGALRPSAGSIRLDDAELAGRPAHLVARAGMVRTFQNGRLFHRLTVLENVLVGAYGRFRGSVAAALLRSPRFRAEEAGMAARARELLGLLGMADQAGRDVGTLPYGSQRRLEIARALIGGPKLLLLDEPAAGLNAAEVAELAQLIQSLRRDGMSILLIEHNMGLVMRLADRITVLNFGRRIASGTPDEVRGDAAVVEAYLGRRSAHAGV